MFVNKYVLTIFDTTKATTRNISRFEFHILFKECLCRTKPIEIGENLLIGLIHWRSLWGIRGGWLYWFQESKTIMCTDNPQRRPSFFCWLFQQAYEPHQRRRTVVLFLYQRVRIIPMKYQINLPIQGEAFSIIPFMVLV